MCNTHLLLYYMMRFLVYFSIIFASLAHSWAHNTPGRHYQIPVKVTPPYLSGNFAELRSNHFHAGIDFKTQGVVGKKIYAFDHGWVSRVSVSPWGYGNAVYITHYSGLTTVYGHLLSFEGELKERIHNLHYEKESFALDVTFEKGEIPVQKGQVFALGGNTGSSAGPHLHFEIRTQEAQHLVDPIPYFADKLKDQTPPQLRQIRLYPTDSAIVNGGYQAVTATPLRNKSGNKILNKSFTAWGNVYLGVKAYDKMDDVHHIYGVKHVRLYVEDSLYFSIQFDDIPLAHSRYINSLIDYGEKQRTRSQMMRLMIDPGNKLYCYSHATNKGIIQINQEKTYDCRIELRDFFGNQTTWPFSIKGKKPSKLIAAPKVEGKFMAYDKDNLFTADGVSLRIPKGSFYTDQIFTYDTLRMTKAVSRIHQLYSREVPLHNMTALRIAIDHDTLENKNQYYLARVYRNYPSYVSASYVDGKMSARVRDLGSYGVFVDQKTPVITAYNPKSWLSRQTIRFKIGDRETGIRSFRGEIDGKYALFTYDGKNGMLSYRMDAKKLGRNRKHQLRLTVVDNCGNETVERRTFYW